LAERCEVSLIIAKVSQFVIGQILISNELIEMLYIML